MLFNDFKLECLKTLCFSKISRSFLSSSGSHETAKAGKWTNMDSNTMFKVCSVRQETIDEQSWLFIVCTLKCWKTLCVQRFQTKMLKAPIFLNDFKLKCLKTQRFSKISSSNVENTMLFNDSKLKCLKNTMLFNDLKLECWNTLCFSMIESWNVEKQCFSMF